MSVANSSLSPAQTTKAIGQGVAVEPSLLRITSVVSAFVLATAGIFAAAHSVAGEPFTPLGMAVSLGGGVLAALLIGSLGE